MRLDLVGPQTPAPDDRYRMLVEAVTDYAIVLVDPDGTIFSWNRGAERLKGYMADEVVGKNFARVFSIGQGEPGALGSIIARVRREGRFETEGWCGRKDGTRFWAHVLMQAITSPEGEITGFAVVCRDRTKRYRAENAHRRNEEQFRLLVDGVRDYAICMLDIGGRVSSWNTGLERMLGYDSDDVMGVPFACFFPEDERAKGVAEAALATAAREGRLKHEGWRVRKQGERFLVNEAIDTVFNEHGDHVGYAVIMRDITEQKTAEKALDAAREALFQSQKTEAIGQLTGGIAHDFNNLLSAILGNLELGRRRLPPDAPAVRFLDNALLGAQRGATLVARMMRFTRHELPEPQSVAVPDLVEGLRELLARAVGPTVAIDVSFPRHLSPIHVDPNQLELVLLNLVVNSRDAMPETGGTIRITARNRRFVSDSGPSHRYVQLSVSDDGKGMDAETLANACEAFFTTKERGKGTGLGLSMAQNFMASVDGHLHLTSKPGKGTTVELWLPAAGGAADDLAPEKPVEEQSASDAERSLRILVVDDDALVLMNTVAMVEELGHEALMASSGAEALSTLRAGDEQDIDLVVTDHAMPKMTGIELGRTAMEEWPDMPVVLATGYADLPQAEDDIPIAVLQKPFGVRALGETIETAIAEATARKVAAGRSGSGVDAGARSRA
ncbi:hybrid sensor histidine kinase/response regulator [Jiella marina]|uniref:hybrid sensor histidine kinase/response regulator n=1 Tax=Jiella sp. LLJ827 TaxID=2917712 RepID=UPI0021014C85|nr:PAS domain-containing sensor histidine kinase [Jiella sp. LLJ827]MCQ0986349.1 PAS domain S-box protein [Jiella sp. LLJ827]